MDIDLWVLIGLMVFEILMGGWIFWSVGFDLDWLVIFGSLVGFDDLATDWVGDDLAWLGFGLGGWLKGFRLSGLVFLDNVGGVCDGSWVVMVAGCGVIVGSDGLWVCEREGQ